ncbi:MAG: ATP-binding protein [Desulfobacterales bacterium]
MPTDTEKEYLIKALEVFKRKILVISSDFTILAANGDFNGMQERIIVGEKCYRVLYNLSCPCEDCPAEEVKISGKPMTMRPQSRYVEPEKPSCLYSYPICTGKHMDAIVMLDFEIPTMEGLEERLRYSNAFLKNLILSSVDGVVAADRTGKILIFNEAAKEISGYYENEAVNRVNIRDIYARDGEAYRIMQKLRENNGKLKAYQVDVRCRDGSSVPISLNAAIVYEGEKEVATVGFFHDMRKTIRMKKELEKTQIQLLQAEKMAAMGKLAAGVAHQLNNPLGGIILFAKLMMEEYDLPEGAKDDLQCILRDAQRCSDTVKELLEFARQPRQNIRINDMNTALSRTLFLLENQTLFHNITIKRLFAENLPGIPADIRQINHMFMNIILNAAEAMGGKGVLTVETRLSADGEHVCIEISDTGPGMPENVLSHIFEPFFTTKEAGKGTGLGLSMVYGIVENHGGKITARSKPGQGTVFLVELPVNPKVKKEGENEGR